MIGEMRPAEAVNHLVEVLSQLEGRVMFATCINEDGFVGDSDCFVSREREIHEVPVRYILDFARHAKAPAAMLTSRVVADIKAPTDHLIQFTKAVIEDGSATGVDLVDHYLVTNGGLISMRESTDLWS